MPPLAQAQVRPTEPLAEVVRRYERHGFPSRFAARPGGNVRCEACQRDHPALWVGLLALHRLGGQAGAGGVDVAVAAVECPACEERGILALGFGPSGPVEDRLVLSLLDDRREESVLDIGLRVGI
jgi:hypothetical protein